VIDWKDSVIQQRLIVWWEANKAIKKEFTIITWNIRTYEFPSLGDLMTRGLFVFPHLYFHPVKIKIIFHKSYF
jgi:hypothetical protein